MTVKTRRGRPKGVAKVSVPLPGLRNPVRLDDMSDLFGEAFAVRLAQALPDLPGSPRTIESRIKRFKQWLGWVAANAKEKAAVSRDCEAVCAHLASARTDPVDEELLGRVCQAYAEFLAECGVDGRPRTPLGTRRGMVSAVLTVLRSIGGRIGLNAVRATTRVEARPGDRTDETHPSLAEITRLGRVDWSNPDHAISELLGHAGADTQSLSFDVKMRAIASLNTTRLAALRRVMEDELAAAYDRFLVGERLLSLPGMPSPEEAVTVLDRDGCDGTVSAWVTQVTGGEPERALGLALMWMLAKAKDGVLPDVSGHGSYRLLVTHNAAAREMLGSKKGDRGLLVSPKMVLQEHVALGWRGWTAAFGILLIDTGWNIQPLMDLPCDPFVGGASSGTRTVVVTKVMEAFKNRSGQNVDAVLAEVGGEGISLPTVPSNGNRFSGVQVVEMVRRMTGRLRSGRDDGPLFLCSYYKSDIPAVPDVQIQSKWWKAVLADHEDDPVIGGLPIVRPMIRKTLLDIAAMENSGDHTPGQLLANHASGATTMQRYLRSPWFRREMANHIRRFTGLFEATLASGIADVTARLGISAEEFATRRSVAMETGLGFACLSATTGTEDGERRCADLDRCHLGCASRRFVPTEQGLVSLVLTNRSLKAAEAEWIIQSPDRWREVWMPLLAETEAYIARLRDSTYRQRLGAAEATVESSLREGDLSLIVPW